LIGLIVGSFVVIALFQPGYALLADGVDPKTAFKRSVDAVKQDWLAATGLAFVMYLILFFSGLCLIGGLVTLPMVAIMTSLAYRDMIGMPTVQQDVPILAPVGSWPPSPRSGEPPSGGNQQEEIPAPLDKKEE
jgi:uncharacterized membrane protein